MNDPDEAYYRAIEEEFVRRRRAPILLSPRDWALIGEWRSSGVPLRIALRGIENVFDTFERRGPTSRLINSLSYCRQEVATLYEIHAGLQSAEAGRPGEKIEGAARAVIRHLGRVARRVLEAIPAASESGLDPLVGALSTAASELKRLRKSVRGGDLDLQKLEKEMRRLDSMVLEAVRASLDADETSRIETLVERRLADQAARMTASAMESTRRASLAVALRNRCALPRLSLFD